MGLLNPALFAGALACVAIPILIHLLMRRRRKPIRWAAMRFLVEAYRAQRKRLLIERWLLLAVRCLAVILLAVALGRPALRAAGFDAPGARTTYLLIDDSLTSTARDASGRSALERHAARAKALLDSMDAGRGDRAGVVLLSRPARGLVLEPSNDLNGVTSLIERLSPTDARADLSSAMGLVLEDLERERIEGTGGVRGQATLVVLSEWLEGTAGEQTSLPALPTGGRVRLIVAEPRSDAPRTVGIERAEPVRTVTVGDDVGGGRVRVRLRREQAGDDAQGASVRVVLRAGDGQGSWSPPVGEAVVRFAPGQSHAETVIAFNRAALGSGGAGGGGVTGGGGNAMRIEIDADDLPGDDVRYAAIDVRSILRVGIASSVGLDRPTSVRDFGPADWVRLALRPGDEPSGLELRDLQIGSLERERLVDLSAIVVVEPARVSQASWGRLREFVQRGGLLVVCPGADEGGSATPVWLGAMSQSLGLEWSAIEPPSELDPALTITAQTAGTESLLGLLSGELGELAGTVPVRRRLGVQAPGGDRVVDLSDQSALLLASPPGGGTEASDAEQGASGRGLVVLLTTSLDLGWTDLPARGLMVPLMQEMIRQGVAAAQPMAGSIAGSTPLAPAGTTELRRAGAEPVLLERGGVAQTAGIYRGQDAQGAATGIALVNPDAQAGHARVRSSDDLMNWLDNQTGIQAALLSADGSIAAPTGESTTRTERLDAGWVVPAILALLLALVLDAVLGRRFSYAESVGAKTSTVLSGGAGGRA